MSYSYFILGRAVLPEITLVAGALVALGYDLIWGRRQTLAERRSSALWIGATALVAALIDSLSVGALGPVYGNTLILDHLAIASRTGVLGLALITLGVAAGSRTPRHPA